MLIRSVVIATPVVVRSSSSRRRLGITVGEEGGVGVGAARGVGGVAVPVAAVAAVAAVLAVVE